MTAFEDVLNADGEYLVKALYRVVSTDAFKRLRRAGVVAASLRLKEEQFVCAFGFNPRLEEFTDIVGTLKSSIEAIKEQRDSIFVGDAYEHLQLGDALAIYECLKSDRAAIAALQPMIIQRFSTIEKAMENLVRPRLLNCHKAELEAVYRTGIAQIEFVESRLADADNGFRSMVNEVQMIADARLVPIGDIFFRESVLPQEKRRLIERGMVPKELVLARLQDGGISAQERSLLESSLRTKLDSTFE